MKYFAALLVLLPFSAWANVVKEEQTTFTYKGKTIPATIKTFNRNGRTFERMYIRVGPRNVTCIPGDQKDCEAAIRDRRNGRDR